MANGLERTEQTGIVSEIREGFTAWGEEVEYPTRLAIISIDTPQPSENPPQIWHPATESLFPGAAVRIVTTMENGQNSIEITPVPEEQLPLGL